MARGCPEVGGFFPGIWLQLCHTREAATMTPRQASEKGAGVKRI